MINVDELAMLPIAFMLGQAEPYERLCAESSDMHDGYREVVNNGIWAFQLHVYLTMIKDRFGGEIWRSVRTHQFQVLDPDENDGKAIQKSISLIDGALGMGDVNIPNSSGTVGVPAEMNIALALLRGDPASPDYVPDVAAHGALSSNLRSAVDSSFSHCLDAACAEMIENFSGVLAHFSARFDPA